MVKQLAEQHNNSLNISCFKNWHACSFIALHFLAYFIYKYPTRYAQLISWWLVIDQLDALEEALFMSFTPGWVTVLGTSHGDLSNRVTRIPWKIWFHLTWLVVKTYMTWKNILTYLTWPQQLTDFTWCSSVTLEQVTASQIYILSFVSVIYSDFSPRYFFGN